jgi:uncharacterized membrane protein
MKFAFSAYQLRRSAKRLKPETVFLSLAFSFGLAALFANAPFQAPDENDHYFRVFQLSEGTLIGEKLGTSAGGILPTPAIDVTDTDGIAFHRERKMTRDLFIRLWNPVFAGWSGARRVFHAFPHTVVYSPAGYLPQTLALFLGRIFGMGPLALMYLARLGSFAASIALGYSALRVLPIYRWTILVLLLCPMSLYLFGSIAPDGMLIAGATLLLARLVRLVVKVDRPVELRDQAIVLILAGILSTAKPVYIPLAGVAVFLIVPKLRSLRERALFATASVVCCLLPVLIWGRVAMALFVSAKGDVTIDPSAQFHHIVGAPLAFLELVAHTIRVQYPYNFRWMVGTLGWGDTPMPDWFYPTFGFGILGCLILESSRCRDVGWWARIAMISAALASTLLIYAAQYASWNPPGSLSPIDGIEGRYFLPLAPALILSFPSFPLRPRLLVVTALAGILSALSASICLWALIFRFYVDSPASLHGPGTARIINFSTRSEVGTKANILSSGFVVSGPGQERLMIRADGPSLAKSGVLGVLSLPSIRVLDSNGTVLGSNTGWETAPLPREISAASAAVDAFAFPPNSADSALLLNVAAGTYTVEVSGANGAAGIVQEEIYELSSTETRLTNFSSRGYVGKGRNVMRIHFAIAGTDSESLLARADGPALARFGVVGYLAQPTLEISPLSTGELTNAEWDSSPQKAEISSAASLVGAFPLARGSADSALVFSIPSGAYDMKIYGSDGTTGIALAEIYELPIQSK